ncbi:g1646 [Coccomyxa viridis]|uniref:G1646 protein n=1 Tax=Coccomyxa viridis TaxID=1274662 RepID=A0ABP1FQD0_9CHLO
MGRLGTRAAQTGFASRFRSAGSVLAAVLAESDTSLEEMSVGKLDPRKTGLFVCDVQEVFREKSLIQGYDAVIDCARRLVRGAAAFEIPVFVTEQYPARLGSTVQEIRDVLPKSCVPVPKTDFTMYVPEIQEQLRQYPEIQSIVLCGIEGHVCVLQTALDLLERKFDVHIVTDGVSSSKWHDRTVGIQRIAQCGGFLATAEMILFQLSCSSKHPAFKQVSALVKESRPDPLPIVSML